MLHAGGQQLAPGEGAVLEVQAWGGVLVCATQQGGLHGWDLRMPRPAWVLRCKPQEVRSSVHNLHSFLSWAEG